MIGTRRCLHGARIFAAAVGMLRIGLLALCCLFAVVHASTPVADVDDFSYLSQLVNAEIDLGDTCGQAGIRPGTLTVVLGQLRVESHSALAVKACKDRRFNVSGIEYSYSIGATFDDVSVAVGGPGGLAINVHKPSLKMYSNGAFGSAEFVGELAGAASLDVAGLGGFGCEEVSDGTAWPPPPSPPSPPPPPPNPPPPPTPPNITNGTNWTDFNWTNWTMFSDTEDVEYADVTAVDDEYSEVDDSAAESKCMITATVTVTADGSPSLGDFTGTTGVHFNAGPLRLDGTVAVNTKCSEGEPLLFGRITLSAHHEMVTVVGSSAELTLPCDKDTVVVKAHAEQIKLDTFMTEDVSMMVTLRGPGLRDYSANFTGVLHLTDDLVKGLLPGFPGPLSSRFHPSLTVANGVNGLEVGKIEMRADFTFEAKSAGMSFTVDGSFSITLPCETGEQMSGTATFSAVASGKFEASDLKASVVYNCGNTTADQPRWSLEVASSAPIMLGSKQVSELFISASSFSSGGLTGVLYGAVEGAGAVSYAFDTRDNSWEVGVSFEYSSKLATASIMFAHANTCKEEGTVGSGTLAISLGDGGKLEGSVSAQKRCGEFAERDGVYNITSRVAGDVSFNSGVTVHVKEAVLSLRSGPESVNASTDTAAAPGFGTYMWEGDVQVGLVQIDIQAIGMTLSGTAEVGFTVDNGVPSIGDVSAEVGLEYRNGPVVLTGRVQVNLPCGSKAGAPMLMGNLSLDMTTDLTTVKGATAKMVYDCTTAQLLVRASVEHAAVGVATMKDVQISLDMSGPKLRYFTGEISASIDSFGELMPTGLPNLDAVEAPPSSFVVSLAKDVSGFRVGKIQGSVLVSKKIKGPQLADQHFSFTGTLDFTYPCVAGESLTGSLLFSGVVSDRFQFDGLNASIVYYCGDIGSGHPRLAIDMDIGDGARLAGLQVKSMHLSARAFAMGATSDLALQGTISASLENEDIGADMHFSFDTRDGSWSAAALFSYSLDDRVDVSIAFYTSTTCTPEGSKGSGTLAISLGNGGKLEGSVSAQKRCGEYAKRDGLYDITAHVTGDVSFSGGGGGDNVVMRLRKSVLSLRSGALNAGFVSTDKDGMLPTGPPDPSNTWNPTFGDYRWEGDVQVGSVQIDIQAIGMTLSGTAEVGFTVDNGVPSIGNVSAEVGLEYRNGPVVLTGRVQVNLPCGSKAGAPMLMGNLSLDVTSDVATVEGANAELAYDCFHKRMTVRASVDSVSIGPASITDVLVSLDMHGQNMAYFTGNISGSVEAFSNLMPDGLPGLPEEESQGVNAPALGDIAGAAGISVRMSLSKTAAGLKIDKALVAVNIAARLTGPEGGHIDAFAVKGRIIVPYPCDTGDRATGDITVSANIPEKLVVEGLVGRVEYNCGKLPVPNEPTAAVAFLGDTTIAGEVTPRWSISVAAEYPIIMAVANHLKIENFTLVGQYFDQHGGRGLKGSVFGVVEAGDSDQSFGGSVAFSFDTRDGSWSAGVSFSYQSETIDVHIVFETQSGCTAEGAKGSGSLAISLGSGSLEGTVSAVKRCGAPAAEHGAYDIHVDASGSFSLGPVTASVGKASLSLRTVPPPSSASPGGENEAAAVGVSTEAGFPDYDWSGAFSAEGVEMAIDVAGGITLSGGMEVTFVVEADRSAAPRVTDARGNAEIFVAAGPVTVKGAVKVRLPCLDVSDDIDPTPLFRGTLTLDIASDVVRVSGAKAEVSYDCAASDASMAFLHVAASVESVKISTFEMGDVSVDLEMTGPGFKTYSGTVKASIGSYGDIVPGGLQGLPEAPTGVSGGVTANVNFYSTPEGKPKFGDLTMSVAVDATFGPNGFQFDLRGAVEAVYPCNTGQQIYGVVYVNARAPGKIEFDQLEASIRYNCVNATVAGADNGNALEADASLGETEVPEYEPESVVPRWSIHVHSPSPILVAGTVSLSDFQLSLDKWSGGGVSGIVSGTVTGSAGGGAFGASSGFSFDTRGGALEWSAAVGITFETPRLTAEVLFKMSSGCTEQGTEGRGLLSVSLGDDENQRLRGTVVAVRRCGKYAAAKGTFDLRVNVSGSAVFADTGVEIHVASATLSLHANATGAAPLDDFGLDEGKTLSPAVDGDGTEMPSSYDQVQFDAFDWEGAVVVTEATVVVASAGLKTTASAEVIFDVNATDGPTLRSLTAKLEVEYASKDGRLSVKGEGVLSLPCDGNYSDTGSEIGDETRSDDASPNNSTVTFITATVSVDINFDGVTLEGGSGVFEVTCGGALFKIAARADRLTVGDTVKVSDVSLEAIFTRTPNGTFAEGSLEGSLEVGVGGGALGASAFFMFNTETGAFSAGVKLTLANDPLYIEIEAEGGNDAASCAGDSAGSRSLRGFVKVDHDVVQLESKISGVAYHCEAGGPPEALSTNVTNAPPLRYDTHFEMEYLSLFDGLVEVTDVRVTTKGYGARGAELSALRWVVNVTGTIEAGVAASAYAINAGATVALSATRDPLVGTMSDFTLDVNAHASASFGEGGVVSFSANASYVYPCDKTLAVSATVDLNFGEDVEFPGLTANLVIFCPGMDSMERAGKAFDLDASLNGEMKAQVGSYGLLTVSQLTLVIHATDSSPVTNPEGAISGIGPRTWFPMPSLSAVDVEGTLTARVSADFSDVLPSASGGGEIALSAWFLRMAGPTSQTEKSVNFTARVFFDYVNDGASLEAHISAEFSNTCVDGQTFQAQGSLDIRREGQIEIANATVSGTRHCKGPSPPEEDANAPNGAQLEWEVQATISSATVMSRLTLEAVRVDVWVYTHTNAGSEDTVTPALGHLPGANTPSFAYIRGEFNGSVSLSSLAEDVPGLAGASALATLGGSFFMNPSDEVNPGLQLEGGVSVVVDVNVDFGDGSIRGNATFDVPCDANKEWPIKGIVTMDLQDPLPKMPHTQAILKSKCGAEEVTIEFSMETFEVTDSVVLAGVEGSLSLAVVRHQDGTVAGRNVMADLTATVAVNAGQTGELQISGAVVFGSLLSPAANVTSGDVPSSPPILGVCSKENMVEGCECGSEGGGNGLPDNPFPSTGLCCDELTRKTKVGEQVSSRVWCKVLHSPPMPPSPKTPPPSPPPLSVCSQQNMVVGCKCGKGGGGNGLPDNPFKSTGLCCDEASKTTRIGVQKLSSVWCKTSTGRKLLDTMDELAPQAMERTYAIEAKVNLTYDDGSFFLAAILEVQYSTEVGSCTGNQMSGTVEVTLQSPRLEASGSIAMLCPEEDGTRTIEVNVTMDTWEVHEMFEVRDVEIDIVAVKKGGGSEGFGQGLSLDGHAKGTLVFKPTANVPSLADKDAFPSKDGGGGLAAKIEIEADVHFIKLSCDAGASMGNDTHDAAAEASCNTPLRVVSSDVSVYFSFVLPGDEGPDSEPKLSLDGEAHFRYPCTRHIKGNATLGINMGSASFDDFVVQITAACGRALSDTEPAFELDAKSTGDMQLGPVTLSNVELYVKAFRFKDTTVPGNKSSLAFDGRFVGFVGLGGGSDLGSGEGVAKRLRTEPALGAAQILMTTEVLFNTRNNTFAVAVDLTFENDFLSAELGVAYKTDCAEDETNAVTGKVTFKPDASKLEGTARVTGDMICGKNATSPAKGYSLVLSMPQLHVKITEDIGLAIQDVTIGFDMGDHVEYPTKPNFTTVTQAVVLGHGSSSISEHHHASASQLRHSGVVGVRHPARLGAAAVAKRAAAIGASEERQRTAWRVNATGTISFTRGSLPMPSLPSQRVEEGGEPMNDGNTVALSAGAMLVRPPWSPSVIVEEAYVRVTFAYDTAKEVGESSVFSVWGEGKVKYPCLENEQAYVTATARVNFNPKFDFTAQATVTYYCQAPLDSKRMSVRVETTEPVEINALSVNNVGVYVDGYYRGNSQTELSAWYFKGTVNGTVTYKEDGVFIEGSATFIFNTDTKSFALTLELAMTMDSVEVNVNVEMATKESCDRLNGNQVVGNLTWTPSGEGGEPLMATLSGAAHCPMSDDIGSELHWLVKHDEKIPTLKVGVKVLKLMNEADEDGLFAEDVVQVEDNAASSMLGQILHPNATAVIDRIRDEVQDYPDFQFDASIFSLAELIPGIKLKSAGVKMYSLGAYNTTLAEQPAWGLEVDGRLEANGADIMEALPVGFGLSFAAVARVSRKDTNVMGLVVRAQFDFDHELMKVSGGIVFTPPPIEFGKGAARDDIDVNGGKNKIKELLCPEHTTRVFQGTLKIPALDRYTERGVASFDVLGKVHCSVDKKRFNWIEASVALDTALDFGIVVLNGGSSVAITVHAATPEEITALDKDIPADQVQNDSTEQKKVRWASGTISGSVDLPVAGLTVKSLEVGFNTLDGFFEIAASVSFTQGDWLNITGDAYATREKLGGCVDWGFEVFVKMDTRYIAMDLEGTGDIRCPPSIDDAATNETDFQDAGGLPVTEDPSGSTYEFTLQGKRFEIKFEHVGIAITNFSASLSGEQVGDATNRTTSWTGALNATLEVSTAYLGLDAEISVVLRGVFEKNSTMALTIEATIQAKFLKIKDEERIFVDGSLVASWPCGVDGSPPYRRLDPTVRVNDIGGLHARASATMIIYCAESDIVKATEDGRKWSIEMHSTGKTGSLGHAAALKANPTMGMRRHPVTNELEADLGADVMEEDTYFYFQPENMDKLQVTGWANASIIAYFNESSNKTEVEGFIGAGFEMEVDGKLSEASVEYQFLRNGSHVILIYVEVDFEGGMLAMNARLTNKCDRLWNQEEPIRQKAVFSGTLSLDLDRFPGATLTGEQNCLFGHNGKKWSFTANVERFVLVEGLTLTGIVISGYNYFEFVPGFTAAVDALEGDNPKRSKKLSKILLNDVDHEKAYSKQLFFNFSASLEISVGSGKAGEGFFSAEAQLAATILWAKAPTYSVWRGASNSAGPPPFPPPPPADAGRDRGGLQRGMHMTVEGHVSVSVPGNDGEPAFSADGYVSYTYPCDDKHGIRLQLTATFHFDVVAPPPGIDVRARVYCANQTEHMYRSFFRTLEVRAEKAKRGIDVDEEISDYAQMFAEDPDGDLSNQWSPSSSGRALLGIASDNDYYAAKAARKVAAAEQRLRERMAHRAGLGGHAAAALALGDAQYNDESYSVVGARRVTRLGVDNMNVDGVTEVFRCNSAFPEYSRFPVTSADCGEEAPFLMQVEPVARVEFQIEQVSVGRFSVENTVGKIVVFKTDEVPPEKDEELGTDTNTNTNTNTNANANANANTNNNNNNNNMRSAKKYLRGFVRGSLVFKMLDDLTVTATVAFDTFTSQLFLMIEVDVTLTDLIGTAEIGIKGYGKMIWPCKELGDLSLGVELTVSGTGVDLIDNLNEGQGLKVNASYDSDCNGHWKVEASMKMSGEKKITIIPGFFEPVIPLERIDVKVEKVPKGKPDPTGAKSPEMRSVFVSAQLTNLIRLEYGNVKMGNKRPVHEVGLTTKECTLGELFADLIELTSGLIGHPMGEGDAIADWFKDNLNAITLPAVKLRFLKSGRSWMMSIIAPQVEFLGVQATFAAYYCSNKAWMIYVGLELPPGGKVPTSNTAVDMALSTITFAFGDSLKMIGFQFASKGKELPINPIGTSVAADFPINLIPWEIPGGPALHIVTDLTRATEGLGYLIRDLMEKMAGDPNNPDSGSAISKLIQSECSPERMKNSAIVLPVSAAEVCIAKTFGDASGRGFPMGKDEMRLVYIKFKACIGTSGAMVAAELEVNFDLPGQQGDKRSTVPPQILVLRGGVELKLSLDSISIEAWIMAKLKGDAQVWANPFGALPKIGIVFPWGVGIGVAISFAGVVTPSYFELEAGFMGCASRIYSKNTMAPVGNPPTPTPEEMRAEQEFKEADEHLRDVKSAIEASGKSLRNAEDPELDAAVENYNRAQESYRVAQESAAAARGVPAPESSVSSPSSPSLEVPGFKDFYCGDEITDDGVFEDPYGEEPTLFKIAIFARITGKPNFAFLLMMRNIYLLRLLLMFFPFITGAFREALVAMKGIFDLITCKKFDISFNMMPFPIFTRGGTEIKSGILIDIEDFNFFNIIKFRRVYIHVQFWPPGVECHIFIDPFEFKIAGVTVLSVKGTNRDQKYAARQEMEEAEQERTLNEEKALLMYQVNKFDGTGSNVTENFEEAVQMIQKREQEELELAEEMGLHEDQLEGGLPDVEYDTICKRKTCYTCQRLLENKGYMDLTCGTPGNIITGVDFAAWGVADTQPLWDFTDQPGLCGLGMGHRDYNLTGFMHLPTKRLMTEVRDHCVGLRTCRLRPIRQDHGYVKGHEEQLHALSVAVKCSSELDFRKSMSAKMIETYAIKCADGCDSCMQTHDTKTQRLECYPDSLIFDIKDAVYGAVDQQPPFRFDPSPSMCNITKIPFGAMCKADPRLVMRVVKRRCLGRQNCRFSPEDMAEMFPNDPCPGFKKRLTVIGLCKRTQMPLAATDKTPLNTFGFVGFESREFQRTAVISLADAYQMRVAFQSSDKVYRTRLYDNATELVWGREHRRNFKTQKIHRVLSKFAPPKEMGANGTHFWLVRITGRQFWAEGGMLSIMSGQFEEEWCGGRGGSGCDLSKCRPAVDDSDSCDLEVRLAGGATYFVMLYGITRDESPGWSVSLRWKPPTTCVLMSEGCMDIEKMLDEANGTASEEDHCLRLNQTAMPWLTWEADRELPWLECRTPWNVEITETIAEVKPFCASPGSYRDSLRKCWPEKHPPKGGCEGVYDASDGHSDRVMFARDRRALQSRDGPVNMVVEQPGKCHGLLDPLDLRARSDRSTGRARIGHQHPDAAEADHGAAVGRAALVHAQRDGERGGRVAHLRFEEGPCPGKVDPDNQNIPGAPETDAVEPEGAAEGGGAQEMAEHKLKCTSSTYGGPRVKSDTSYGDVDARLYTFPVGHMGDSAKGVVRGGKLKAERSGEIYVEPGHSGRFSANMQIHTHHNTRPLVAVQLPDIGPKRGKEGDQGAVAMWFKKQGAISEKGETLFSWTPQGALQKSTQRTNVDKKYPPDAMAVVLEPDSRLRFFSVFETDEEIISFEAGMKPVHAGETVRCQAESVAIPELANNQWHHVAVVIQAARRNKDGVQSIITFDVDGAHVEKIIKCEKHQPNVDGGYITSSLGFTPGTLDTGGGTRAEDKDETRDRLSSDEDEWGDAMMSEERDQKNNAIPDTFNDLERSLDIAGTGRVEFLYRDEYAYKMARGELLIGATYDMIDDTFNFPVNALIDSVSVYDDVALTRDEILALATDMPCAERYSGAGYAFFPGTQNVHGPEVLEIDTAESGRECRAGPHTVAFRYLASQGNRKSLVVSADESPDAGDAARVPFHEPEGYDEDAVDVWLETGPGVVNVPRDGRTTFKASAPKPGAPPPPPPPPYESRRPTTRRRLQSAPATVSGGSTLSVVETRSETAAMPLGAVDPYAGRWEDGKLVLSAGKFGEWLMMKFKTTRPSPPPPMNATMPPPPFVFDDHTEMCRRVIEHEMSPRELSDMRQSNFEGDGISHTNCKEDLGDFATGDVKGLGDQDKRQVDTGTWTGIPGWYIVTGEAGAKLLELDDVEREDSFDFVDKEGNIRQNKVDTLKQKMANKELKQDVVYGSACGYKFPGRIQKFYDNAWKFAGGSSKGKVCFGVNNFGDEWAQKSECWFHVDIEVHNCETFYLHKLPTITDLDLKTAAGRLFVKVAYLHLPRMHDDDFLHRCDERTITNGTMLQYHRYLCDTFGFGVGHGTMYGGNNGDAGKWAIPCEMDDAMTFLTLGAHKSAEDSGDNVLETETYVETFGSQIKTAFDCERRDIRDSPSIEGVTGFTDRGRFRRGRKLASDDDEDDRHANNNATSSFRAGLGWIHDDHGWNDHTSHDWTKELSMEHAQERIEAINDIIHNAQNDRANRLGACEKYKNEMFAGFKKAGKLIDQFWKRPVQWYEKPCLEPLLADDSEDEAAKVGHTRVCHLPVMSVSGDET